MGIAGLLQVLEGAQRTVHVSELRGKRVAVDGYCWLHRAAYSCALELCTGAPTGRFLNYCSDMVDMLLHHDIVPIVVLDGGPLPSKSGQEETRRTRREENLAKGRDALRQGNRSLAMTHFQKAVDITPAMAAAFERELTLRGVRFVVAPFEADAQLAYLALSGQVDAVVTEDSDMVPYGVPCTVLKLDKTGNGKMLRMEDIVATSEMRNFTQQMVRQSCILAGCDYLESVNGMGIRTAIKHMKTHKDAARAIRALRVDGSFRFPADYEASFQKAELTFKHQQVYDTTLGKAVPLSPLPDGVVWESLESFLGPMLTADVATGIAEGKLDPITKQPYSQLQQLPTPSPQTHRVSRTVSPPQKNTLLSYFSSFSFRTATSVLFFTLDRAEATPKTTPQHEQQSGQTMTAPIILQSSPHVFRQFKPPSKSQSALPSASPGMQKGVQTAITTSLLVKSRFFSRMSKDSELIEPCKVVVSASEEEAKDDPPEEIIDCDDDEVSKGKDEAETQKQQKPPEPQQQHSHPPMGDEDGEEEEGESSGHAAAHIGFSIYSSAFTTKGRLTLPRLDKFSYASEDSFGATNSSGDADGDGDGDDCAVSKTTPLPTLPRSPAGESEASDEPTQPQLRPTLSLPSGKQGGFLDRLEQFLYSGPTAAANPSFYQSQSLTNHADAPPPAKKPRSGAILPTNE